MKLFLPIAFAVTVTTAASMLLGTTPAAQVAVRPHAVTTTPSPSPTVTPTPSVTPKATIAPVATPKAVTRPAAAAKPIVVPTPSPKPATGSKGVVTPYNGNCFADCFPDLTPEAMVEVGNAYKGSFDDPVGFKGLPNDYRLRHYTCEYLHVLNYPAISKECAAAMSSVDPSKP